MEISSEYLLDVVERAVSEDVGSGDVTTRATVDLSREGRAIIKAKQEGIISGLDVAALVFYFFDEGTRFTTDLVEGSAVSAGIPMIKVEGNWGALLSGERVALNFLMHLSGIATLTSQFVHQVSHTSCRILDTRKTTPGLRLLEKRAVRAGGGENHRFGLFDMILIKENHIDAAGSIDTALTRALASQEKQQVQELPIEVETRSIEEVKQVLKHPIQRIMLDNFSVFEAAAAVKIIRDRRTDLEIEASGNMTLENVREYAETGVDFISVGAITQSAPRLDLSMTLQMF